MPSIYKNKYLFIGTFGLDCNISILLKALNNSNIYNYYNVDGINKTITYDEGSMLHNKIKEVHNHYWITNKRSADLLSHIKKKMSKQNELNTN